MRAALSYYLACAMVAPVVCSASVALEDLHKLVEKHEREDYLCDRFGKILDYARIGVISYAKILVKVSGNSNLVDRFKKAIAWTEYSRLAARAFLIGEPGMVIFQA